MVTARDEEQRKSYEEQIELKKTRAEIPGLVKLVHLVLQICRCFLYFRSLHEVVEHMGGPH